MCSYAKAIGQDKETWGGAGLLHDFDWDICLFPEEHPVFDAVILQDHEVPEELVRVILSHDDHNDVHRETLSEKYVYAVDELSGLITAMALVRPNKPLTEGDTHAAKRK